MGQSYNSGTDSGLCSRVACTRTTGMCTRLLWATLHSAIAPLPRLSFPSTAFAVRISSGAGRLGVNEALLEIFEVKVHLSDKAQRVITIEP